MKVFLADATNDLNSIKSNKLVNRSSVIKASKRATEAATALANLTVDPAIKTNQDAQEEANRLNMFRLAAIGLKEGVAVGISKVFGTDITDTTLRTTDGKDYKTANEYNLYNLMKEVIEGAERPAATDVRKVYVTLCLTKFDF